MSVSPRFGRITAAKQRSGLGRGALYQLAGRHTGLFRKYRRATLVDLELLDEILAALPPAKIRTSTESKPPSSR